MLSIALGVAASLSAFAVADQVLFRPLPFPDADRLVLLQERNVDDRRLGGSVAESVVAVVGERSRTLESVAAFGFGGDRSIVTIDGSPHLTKALDVTPNMFQVLGVALDEGRAASTTSTPPASSVILSHRLASKLTGRRVEGRWPPVATPGGIHEVAGVLPPGFVFPPYVVERDPDFYALFQLRHGAVQRARVLALGRLRNDLDLPAARLEVGAISRRVYADLYGDTHTEVWLADLREQILGRSRPAAWQLVFGTGLFAVVAWSNAAQLLLSSYWARRRETATRAALGAGGRALATVAMGEVIWITATGVALGAMASSWFVPAVSERLPPAVAPLGRPVLDMRAIAPGFVLGLGTASGLAITTASMWRRVNLRALLTQGDGLLRPRSGISMQGLMVAGAVLSGTIVVTAALASAAQLWREFSPPLGFVPRPVLVAKPTFPPGPYDDPGPRHRFLAAFADAVASRPGIAAVGTVDSEPLSGATNPLPYSRYRSQEPSVDFETRVVGHDYFRTLGIPVLRGTPSSREAVAAAAGSVILSELAARRTFGTSDEAVGKTLLTASGSSLQVVGVVGDIRDTRAPTPTPMVYRLEHPPLVVARSLVIRCEGNPNAIRNTVREAAARIDGRVALELYTLAELRGDVTALASFTAWLSGLAAVVVTIQVLLGIFGLARLQAASRQHEAAIRMALGDTPAAVRRRIARGCVGVVLVGVGCGALGALAAVRSGGLVPPESGSAALLVVVGAVVCGVIGIASSYVAVRRAVPESAWRLLRS